jgi:3alpha(or 20beta)-hydroxysteroid dehydrogenase
MGKSHVRHFVAEGARVVSGDVLDDRARPWPPGSASRPAGTTHHDVTSEDDWAAAVALTLDAFGRLDILVNNAGIVAFASIADMPLADFRRVLEVNAAGCWLGMKAVTGPMTAAGGGSIVNISSIEGFTGAEGLSAYSASKFAVRGMTKVAARELARFGIRVNSVHPGGVLTRMVIDSAGAARPGTGRRSSRRCRWAGSPSRSRSRGWSRTWPPTSRPTRPAASSSPTAASWPGRVTDLAAGPDAGPFGINDRADGRPADGRGTGGQLPPATASAPTPSARGPAPP